MSNTEVTQRNKVILKSAQVTAEVLFNIELGMADTSCYVVDGESKIKPFIGMVNEALGSGERVVEITDDKNVMIRLSDEERVMLEDLTQVMLQHYRDTTPTTQDEIYEHAQRLVKHAEVLGAVIKLNMPTAHEKSTHGTNTSIMVSSIHGGKVLFSPEPNSTGMKYNGG